MQYGKHEANIISGIAILLMLAHHFFGFKDYLRADVDWISICSISGIEIERIIAAFGKICVSIFAFNSGYVLWTQKEQYKSLKLRFNRILQFLICYWMICILFWIFALSVGDEIPDGQNMLMNLVGLNTGPQYAYVNVAFGWYVAYYIFFVLVSPLILWGCSSRHWMYDVLILVLVYVIGYCCTNYCEILHFVWPIYISVAAVLVAKYQIFQHIPRIRRVTVLSAFMIIGVLVFCRQSVLLFGNQYITEWGG